MVLLFYMPVEPPKNMVFFGGFFNTSRAGTRVPMRFQVKQVQAHTRRQSCSFFYEDSFSP